LQVWIARTLSHKAYALDLGFGELERSGEVLAEIVDRFSSEDSAEQRGLVNDALHDRARIFARLGSNAEAIVLLDSLLGRLEEPPTDEQRTVERWKVLATKSGALVGEGRYEEALALADELLDDLGDPDAPDLRDAAAFALNTKIAALYALDREYEAEFAFTELVSRFPTEALQLYEFNLGDVKRPERLAAGLVAKAKVLEELGRDEEARSTLGEAIVRFGSSDDEKAQAFVDAAREALERLQE
jgi:tetratricopeptide (TPR) repeat protein